MVRKSENVYGPYRDRVGRDGHHRWIVKFTGPDGDTSESFAGPNAEADARAFVEAARAKLAGLKVSDAIGEYLRDLEEGGNRSSSLESTGCRLRTFFQASGGRNGGLLADITPARAKLLLEATKVRRRVICIRDERNRNKVIGHREVKLPRSVTYRAGMLAEVVTFARWCAGKGYIRLDNQKRTPVDGLTVLGKRRRGKKQMRVDEFKTWERLALDEADRGDVRSFVAVLTFYLGTRVGETLKLCARDIDRDGRDAVVDDSKTESGKRRVEIPEHLQGRLFAFKRDRAPGELLFPGITRSQVLGTVKRLCRAAGVTEVTTQSLRGLHSTLADEIGATGRMIADQLGHADEGQTSERHYSEPGSRQRAAQRRVLTVMNGGRP
jgi:integrase